MVLKGLPVIKVPILNTLPGLGEALELAVCLDFVDYGADDLVGLAVLGVVGGDGEVDAALVLEGLGEGFLLRIALVADGHRVATEHLDDLHTRDVGLAVTEIDHLRVRDPLLVLGDALVDHLVVVRAEDSLVDLEYVLGLGRVVHGDSRPFRLSLFVIHKGAGEDVLELLGDRAAFDDLLQSGRVDVVLDLDTARLAIFIDQAEPFLHSFEELDVAAELAEVAPPELDAVLLRLVEHHLHIREDVARVLADSEAVAHPPELLRGLPDGLDETELLHIPGRKGPVEVINQRNNRSFLHNFATNNRFLQIYYLFFVKNP